MDNYSSILKAVQEFDELFLKKVTTGLFQKEVSPEPTIESTLATLEAFKKTRDFTLISAHVNNVNRRQKPSNRKQSKENVNPNAAVNNSDMNRVPYVKMERISEEAMINIKESMKKNKKRVVKMEPKSPSADSDVEIINSVEIHAISDDDADEIIKKPKNTLLEIKKENLRSTRTLTKMLPPKAQSRTTRTKTKADTEEVNIRSTRSKTRNKNTNAEISSDSGSAKSSRVKQIKEKISSENVQTKTGIKDTKRSRSQSASEPERHLKKLKTSKHDDTSVYEDAVEDMKMVEEASYHQSPVKKRVEAYEKMTETPPPQMRITRTKTKMLAAVNAEVVTPVSNRLITPSKMSTMKNMIVTGSETRTLKALKSSQKMFKEREKLRLQKEAELAKRKEELVLEKQRKNELEKRRLKRLEERKLQKKHEEELKRIEQEMKRKIAEEECRRKEDERRRKEEERRIKEEERRRQEEERKRAKAQKAKKQPKNDIYMLEEAPLLPTYDCYDSDDAESVLAKKVVPHWLNREELTTTLNIMESFIKPKVMNTLFCPMPQTPNLLDIFDNVNPVRLKRNSSAIWSKPPRFTMMPINIPNI